MFRYELYETCEEAQPSLGEYREHSPVVVTARVYEQAFFEIWKNRFLDFGVVIANSG